MTTTEETVMTMRMTREERGKTMATMRERKDNGNNERGEER